MGTSDLTEGVPERVGPRPPERGRDGVPGRETVFISYSRQDRPFVERLAAELERRGRSAWVDWQDIPPSAEWMAEIEAAIDAADAFIFVVSPDSVASQVCRLELARAADSHKRIVPILHREVDDALVPEAARERNWIEYRDEDDPATALDLLVTALDTDLERVRSHARLLVRAREWIDAERDRALLLRGSDLQKAETLIGTGGDPAPTGVQTAYVVASRKAATKRQQGLISGVSLALLVALVLGVVAFQQRLVAIDQRDRAEAGELAATALADKDADPQAAVAAALEAVRLERSARTEQALREALATDLGLATVDGAAAEEAAGLPMNGDGTREIETIESVAFTTDGSALLTGGGDGVVASWDPTTGEPLANYGDLFGWVVALEQLPDGRIVAAGHDGSGGMFTPARGYLSIIDGPAQGDELLRVDQHRVETTSDIHAMDVRTDGSLAATGGSAGALRVWDVTGTQPVETAHARPLPGRAEIYGTAWSPDGRRIAVGTSAGAVLIYDEHANLLGEVGSHLGAVTDLVFTPDGRHLVSVGSDRLARIWDAETFEPLGVLPHDVRLRAVATSASGTLVATADNDGVGHIWDLIARTEISRLVGHERWFTDIAMSGEGLVGTASADRTARTWGVGSTAPLLSLEGKEPRYGPPLRATFVDDERIAFVDPEGHGVVADATTGQPLATIPDGDATLPGGVPAGFLRRLGEAGPSRVLAFYEYHGRKVGDPSAAWTPTGTDPILLERQEDDGRDDNYVPPGGDRVQRLPWDDGLVVPSGERALVWGERSSGGGLCGSSGCDFDESTDFGMIDLADGSLGTTFSVDGTVADVAVSPDGRLAAVFGGQTVRVYDLADGGLVRALKTGQNDWEERAAVTFAPDGRGVITSGPNGTILFWDDVTAVPDESDPCGIVTACEPSASLETDHAGVTDLAVTPDGMFLVSAGVDGAVRVWEASGDHGLVTTFRPGSPQQGLDSVKFAQPDVFAATTVDISPNGRLIVAATAGWIRVYRCSACVPFQDLIDDAAGRVAAQVRSTRAPAGS